MFGLGQLCAVLWLLAAGDTVSGWPDRYFLIVAGLLLSVGVGRRFERR